MCEHGRTFLRFSTHRSNDWINLYPVGLVIKMARWNKGIMEPEHRLWMFTLSLILIPGSLILCGVGVAHHVHWFGLVFAMCIIAITNTIGVQVSVSYCIDSYQDLSGEAMIIVILVRNTMSFAVGYGYVCLEFKPCLAYANFAHQTDAMGHKHGLSKCIHRSRFRWAGTGPYILGFCQMGQTDEKGERPPALSLREGNGCRWIDPLEFILQRIFESKIKHLRLSLWAAQASCFCR